MSGAEERHVSDQQLLLFADGELGEKDTDQVRSHLEACWSCRTRLDDLQAVIKSIVHFRNDALLPSVPSPPRPWTGLEPRLDELDKRLEKRSVFEQLRDAVRPMFMVPRYAVLAMAILLATTLLIWWPRQRVVSAAELLSRAKVAESSELHKVAAPVVHQKARVRRKVTAPYREVSSDYETWSERSRGRSRLISSNPDDLSQLQKIYQFNGLDWQMPLSASGYARWRESLRAKMDSVEENAGQLLLTTVASEVPSGLKIGKAQLVLRASDWHPMQEQLWLEGEEYEITELQYEVLPLASVSAAIFGEIPTEATPLSMVPRPVRHEPAFDPAETEMAVRYQLHQIGADLGEPIEITRDPRGETVVKGLGLTPERQVELRKRLGSMRNVSLDFSGGSTKACEGCAVPQLPPAATARSAPLTVVSRWTSYDERLAKFFETPEAQQTFTQSALAASDAALARAFALRALAMRYSPAEETKLNMTSRAQLHAILAEHAAALGEQYPQMENLLMPLLRAMAQDLPADTAAEFQPPATSRVVSRLGIPPPLGWQRLTLELFSAVQQTDRLTKTLLASTSATTSPDQVMAQLAQALVGERQRVKQYLELLDLTTQSKE